jgi:hypothetical protein
MALGAVALGVAALNAWGCSSDLLRFTKTGPPPIPEKPQPTYEHQEAVRELADLSARTLDRVHVEGVLAAAPSIGQAAQAAAIVSADVGPPAAPLPLPEPGAYEPVPQVDEALARAEAARAAHGRAVAKYEARLADYAATPVKRMWAVGVPLLATWGGLLVLGLGVALAFRAAVKYKAALWQVFVGVREFLAYSAVADSAAKAGNGVGTQVGGEACPPGRALKASLDKSMDSDAKTVIQNFYSKVGE